MKNKTIAVDLAKNDAAKEASTKVRRLEGLVSETG